MALTYRHPTSVLASEVTPCGAQKPFHLLACLQNSADAAVDDGGIPDGRDFGCAWMVHQYSIVLDRPLVMGQQFHIDTGHQPRRDLYSIRRFILEDQDGPFGLADSAWILVDLESRRPQRLSRRLQGAFYDRAEEPFEEQFTVPLAPQRTDIQRVLEVRMGDLDGNGHVNNAYYLAWASEALPWEVYMTSGLLEAHILFVHEATYGMTLTVTTQQESLSFRHRIENQQGQEIALVNTRWAPLGGAAEEVGK